MITYVWPLGMSLVVLQALRKIEIDIPESMDENDDNDVQMTSQLGLRLFGTWTAMFVHM